MEGPRKWSEVVKMCYWWIPVVSDSGNFCAVFFNSHNPNETGREFDFRSSLLESRPSAFISYR